MPRDKFDCPLKVSAAIVVEETPTGPRARGSMKATCKKCGMNGVIGEMGQGNNPLDQAVVKMLQAPQITERNSRAECSEGQRRGRRPGTGMGKGSNDSGPKTILH